MLNKEKKWVEHESNKSGEVAKGHNFLISSGVGEGSVRGPQCLDDGARAIGMNDSPGLPIKVGTCFG